MQIQIMNNIVNKEVGDSYDYLTKPFSPNELVARVKAHINRFEHIVNRQQSHTHTG